MKILVVWALLFIGFCPLSWAGGNLSIFDTPGNGTTEDRDMKAGEEAPTTKQATPLNKRDDSSDSPGLQEDDDDDDDDWGEDTIYDNDKSC